MKKKNLRVVYDGPPDSRVDKLVRESLETIGYKWWASGYNHIDDERDIAFDKEIDAAEAESETIRE